jgi:hypothetical protein
MKKYRIASGFAPFSPCADRFNVAGYREPMSLEQQFAPRRGSGVSRAGLDYPYQPEAEAVRPPLQRPVWSS